MSGKVTIREVTFLVLLATFWGSSSLFVKIAVTDIPPLTQAAVRVALGALVIYVIVRMRGDSLPRDWGTWGAAAVVALIGTVIPFFLIGWGLKTVDAALAAIAMASVPLYTLPLAHVMTRDERLTPLKVTGVVIGFAGVALLVSGSLDSGPINSLPGLIAILVAALGYAVSGLLIRRIPAARPTTTGAAILIAATAMLVPLSLCFDQPWRLTPGTGAIASVMVLGVFATGAALLLLIAIINRAGATFASLNNYLVPVVGIICGVLWLDERLSPVAIIAFAIIMGGIFLTSRKIDPGP
ncbi:MAG: EamA family transporter [Sphingomonadales bacterium]